jgi:hypothetical protein
MISCFRGLVPLQPALKSAKSFTAAVETTKTEEEARKPAPPIVDYFDD